MNNNDNWMLALSIAVAVLLGMFAGAGAGVIAWSSTHHTGAAALIGVSVGGGAVKLFLHIIGMFRK